MWRLLLSLISLLFFQSCRKDHCESIRIDISTKDTIYPNPYYPAYPGSWWEYDDETRVEVDSEWVMYPLLTSSKVKQCRYSIVDSIYCPKIQSKYVIGDTIMWYYNDWYSHKDLWFNSSEMNWDSYKDPSEQDWSLYCWQCDHYYTKRHDSLIDFITVNGIVYTNVIFINEVFYSGGSGYYGRTGTSNELYYAKDVGIIRSVSVHPVNTDDGAVFERDTVELVNYFINN